MLLIPSIDLRGGQCVRLLRGDFSAETRYALDPVDLLRRYRELGAPWLHLVDLDGARDGQLANQAIIAALAAESGIALQIGGGVRSAQAGQRLLTSGVKRLVIGSAAVERPAEVLQWGREFGPDALCIALDVRLDGGGIPRVQIRGWTEGTALSLWDALAPYAAAGIKDVLCTDIARDGALEGPSLALYREAVRRFPEVRWQASGGVRDAADLQALADVGMSSAISGKALLDGHMDDATLSRWFHAGSR